MIGIGKGSSELAVAALCCQREAYVFTTAVTGKAYENIVPKMSSTEDSLIVQRWLLQYYVHACAHSAILEFRCDGTSRSST